MMKRILHISKYYYPFSGGTEQIARDCVNALKDEYEQKVIAFNEMLSDADASQRYQLSHCQSRIKKDYITS